MADGVEMANDEGANPAPDIRKQNPNGSTTADQTDAGKAAKTRPGGPDEQPTEGSG